MGWGQDRERFEQSGGSLAIRDDTLLCHPLEDVGTPLCGLVWEASRVKVRWRLGERGKHGGLGRIKLVGATTVIHNRRSAEPMGTPSEELQGSQRVLQLRRTCVAGEPHSERSLRDHSS